MVCSDQEKEKKRPQRNHRPYLGTHEDDICVCSQPVDKDLYHLDQALVGQDLQLLQQGFFTGDRLRAALAAFRVRVQVWTKFTPREKHGR